jgi:regulatory protein
LKLKPEQVADPVAIRAVAMDLLARREHSEQELAHKLATRGFEADAITDALQVLVSDGLLSNRRFAEAFVHSRFQRGAGPQKIRAELRERGIDDELTGQCIEALDEDWQARLREVREKKFGAGLPEDFRERARQMRFLQQRGFSAEQIARVLHDDE